MGWSPWLNHDLRNPGPQTFVGTPAAVSRSDDFINVYARAEDNQLLQYQWRRQDGFSWWTPHTDGGLLSSSPSAASRNGDHEVVAIRGTDNRLWVKEWTAGGGWTSWARRGGDQTIVDGPEVICRTNDVINIYARGTDDRLLQTYWQSGTGWRPDWQLHEDGGLITSAPSVISHGPDHEAVFARGTDRRLWWKEWRRDRGWSGWQQLGGSQTFQDGPAALARNSDVINVYARGDDNALIQISWARDGGWRSDWQRHGDGGVITAAPSAVRLVEGGEMIFARGTDGKLWSKWWARDGILTMPLHFKFVDGSGVGFTLDEVRAATQLVFAGALVWAPIASVETINDPTLLDINVGACTDWGLFTTFNSGQDALFDQRSGAASDDIVVYFVRSASGFAGCAVHPGDRPGCLVTMLASEWVAAHEIAHVLGRGHEGSSRARLMWPVDENTELPPNLGADQVGANRHIRRR